MRVLPPSLLVRSFAFPAIFLLSVLAPVPSAAAADDPLPSWNEGPAKHRIVAFVRAVTDGRGPHHGPAAGRIAVFDNDGTLWGEQPMCVQLAFALDRIRELAPSHPEWKEKEPFRSALAGDLRGVAATGERGVLELVMASHAGNTTDEFDAVVNAWLATARHPTLHQPYPSLVYQPMLELLAYLRANGFKTFIVSGGGVDFLRVFAAGAYGVPPEQVIGSSIRVKYESHAASPSLARLPEIDFLDDKAGKPVAIHSRIGRRPIAVFGNSDGDFEMLEWTTTGPGLRLGMLVRHDDAKREFAYDRESSFGRLERALDEASSRGWVITSMKNDWARIHPPSH